MKHKKILMIDDSRDDANLVRRSFKAIDDEVEVTWMSDAENGCAFLETTTEDTFDLILLDIKMPKMTGLEILERLAEKDIFPKLPPIIVFSSSSLEIDSDRANRYPTVTYQKKPEGYLDMKKFARELTARFSNGFNCT